MDRDSKILLNCLPPSREDTPYYATFLLRKGGLFQRGNTCNVYCSKNHKILHPSNTFCRGILYSCTMVQGVGECNKILLYHDVGGGECNQIYFKCFIPREGQIPLRPFLSLIKYRKSISLSPLCGYPMDICPLRYNYHIYVHHIPLPELTFNFTFNLLFKL